MAMKKNEFTDNWIAFHEVAVNLSHLLRFLPWQLTMARKATERSLDVLEKQGMRGKFGAATGLSIINVFRERKDEFTYRAPAGKRATQGDDITKMLSEVEGRFNNSVLLSIHEALEVYVTRLYAEMRYQLRNHKHLKNKGAFHATLPKPLKHEGTPEYFATYAAWACKRNCRQAFGEFKNEVDWSSVQHVEWRGIEWVAVADTLSLCRNCIAHDEGRVPDAKLNEKSKPQQAFVRSLMKESMLTGEQHILFEKDQACQLLEAIVTLGYVLYVLLSNRFDMKIDVKLGAIKNQQKTN